MRTQTTGTANRMAKGISMSCDGLHTKALLADNAASARQAREMAAAVGQIEAEYTVSISDGDMVFLRRDNRSGSCRVRGLFDADGRLTVKTVWCSPLSGLPAEAFETAALNRAIRNRDARLAAAQEAGK